MRKIRWWIPGNVPSSKNGRRWTGKYFIASKAVMNYRKATKDIYLEYGNPIIEFSSFNNSTIGICVVEVTTNFFIGMLIFRCLPFEVAFL